MYDNRILEESNQDSFHDSSVCFINSPSDPTVLERVASIESKASSVTVKRLLSDGSDVCGVRPDVPLIGVIIRLGRLGKLVDSKIQPHPVGEQCCLNKILIQIWPSYIFRR